MLVIGWLCINGQGNKVPSGSMLKDPIPAIQPPKTPFGYSGLLEVKHHFNKRDICGLILLLFQGAFFLILH